MALELKISGLKKSYDRRTNVLDLAELTVNPGEIFFLLGSSGCGKSTLLRILAGLLAPDAGSIIFDDRDVTGLPPEKRQCAMVFQNYALWPHLTVGENIAFGLKTARRSSRQIADTVGEMLNLVRLDGYADRRIGSLSGGQQQRVALARALAVRPRLLLLDEPLSNLDAQLRDSMRLEIRRLIKERDLTAIYVTHDRREALSIADRIGVMHHGHIAEAGAPVELYRNPRSRFTAEFLGGANFVSGTAAGRDGVWIRVDTALGGLLARDSGDEIAPGTPVKLLLRPEHLRFTERKGEEANVIAGELAESVFLGESAEYQVRCAGDVELMLSESPAAAAPSGRVNIVIAPENTVILSGSTEDGAEE